MQSAELSGARAGAVAVATAIWLISVALSPAHGQVINLGGRGWSAADGGPVTSDRTTNQLEFDVRAGFASDYIYRGTTLSDHKPAVGTAIEATFGQLYGGVAVASVKLPTQPAAEITINGGVRQKIGDIDFDLRATYFLYPGEIPVGVTNDIDYWEAGVRADKRITESIRVAAGFAYSPNVSNTGAWSKYVAAGLGYDVPSSLLRRTRRVVHRRRRRSRLGVNLRNSAALRPPADPNWQAGATSPARSSISTPHYYDTNLSKGNCFVLTGDPNAHPGAVLIRSQTPKVWPSVGAAPPLLPRSGLL